LSVSDTRRRSEDYGDFLEAWPAYESTRALDEVRRTEFSRLDSHGHVYLDYTGGGLYGDSQIRRHAELLRDAVLGNPHSTNPTSAAATERVERCRDRVLGFFGASAEEYVAIFTANASHALKLVGESYPFGPDSAFLLTFDNHNSVNGIREFHRARGTRTTYVPVLPPDMRTAEDALAEQLRRARPGVHNLFAYPAQSNFSGVQHPLEWIEQAQSQGWDVLLDAAAFVPTNRLDLARWKPDYVSLSFYKMFGYPTGVGVLLARRPALEKLRRPWFAGGTITIASVQADRHFLASGAAAFEDGTSDYAGIPAVEIGLDFLESVGFERIQTRARCLTGWLLGRLEALRHSNGRPLVVIYGPRQAEQRGATITFNLHASDGSVLDHRAVEARANRQRISIRTGCFCNPGAGEMALGLSKSDLESCLTQPGTRMTQDDFRRCIDGKSTGAVRVSMGLATTFGDVQTFLRFVEGFIEPAT
jgi:selenocysteine lyase/cysteine desulfurase